jgi:DNA-binding beta-propeller fold protein YncE
MDEEMLRNLLHRTVDQEPPIGSLARNALQAGIKRRRRLRATGAASSAAVVAALAFGAPALGGVFAPATAPRPARTTAYVVIASGETVPINTVTGRAGRPIRTWSALPYLASPTISATPNGRTVYVLGQSKLQTRLTVIDPATNTATRVIEVSWKALGAVGMSMAPSGKTAYIIETAFPGRVIPVDTAANITLKPIAVSIFHQVAVVPGGTTAYVVGASDSRWGFTGLIPIRVATNRALGPITFHVPTGYNPAGIVLTPNGATAYVLDSSGASSNSGLSSEVTPVSLHTGKVLKDIRLKAPGSFGTSGNILMDPDGQTAYVLGNRTVTPVSTATNTQLKPITLPASVGDAQQFVMTPNGKTLYVLSTVGITPISLTTGKVLKPIRIQGIPSPGLASPGSNIMAITPDGRTLYVGARNGVVLINTATNTVREYIDLSPRAGGGRVCGIAFAR